MIRVALPLAVFGLFCLMAAAQAQSDLEIYAKACSEAVGTIPDFSCADGTVVPVTVDGAPIKPAPQSTCDRPALSRQRRKLRRTMRA